MAKKNCLKTQTLLKPRHLSLIIAGRVELSSSNIQLHVEHPSCTWYEEG